MTKVNKILLVGLGSIGKRHLNNIQKLLPHATILILRSKIGEVNVDGCEVVTNIEAAIAFQPDLAVICGPSSYHLDVAERLASEGVHMLIEKPLSNDVRGVPRFIKMIKHSELKVMIGYNLRFNRSLLEFKLLLDTERYGKSLVVSAEVGQYLPSWRPSVDYRKTVSAQAELGGGVLLELSHELDYLLWLFGQVVTVSAKIAKVSDLDIDVEDLVLAHLGFSNDKKTLLASVHLDFLQRQPYRRCKVICEKATLVWDAISGSVEVHEERGISTLFKDDSDRNYTYERELETLIYCIENETKVPIDVDDGLSVLSVVEAIKISSESGTVIHI